MAASVHCTIVNAFQGTMKLKHFHRGQYLEFKPQSYWTVETSTIWQEGVGYLTMLSVSDYRFIVLPAYRTTGLSDYLFIGLSVAMPSGTTDKW